ncbi:glycosyltransferase [Acidimangrovimonas sediminis]|uniref:glycosyltransferase n=1 Tax=Acidimangrovimonas sediminis TaxID=2056283 RepID=UPI000C80E10E|nr:glycosyltransferase [Acidimangrovimonas sediminis]
MNQIPQPLPLAQPALVPASALHGASRGRIRHVIDGLGPGGAERLLAAYLPRIASQGFEVDVVALQEKFGNHMHGALTDGGIPVTRLEVSKLRNLRQVRSFLQNMRATAPDLIHAHLEFATLLGSLSGRMLNRPVVATLHTLDLPGLSSRRDMRRWLMYRTMARWTDRTICLTNANAESARNSGLGRARILVLPNGVEIEDYDAPPRTSRAELRRSFGIAPTAPLIVSVCVLRPEKGVDRLLRAFPAIREAVPAAHLLVVGDGVMRAKWEELAWSEGIADRVHFAGQRRDVADIMRAADLFALPTLFDAQPTVVMEAMAARLPVVASHVGGIPDMVEDGITGRLVRPDNPSALARAIIPLLADPALAQGYGAAGRQRVETDFSMDRQIAKLCTLYDGLIEANRWQR